MARLLGVSVADFEAAFDDLLVDGPGPAPLTDGPGLRTAPVAMDPPPVAVPVLVAAAAAAPSSAAGAGAAEEPAPSSRDYV